MIDPVVENLIRAIYDCVIDPSGWEDVLQRIVTHTHGVAAALEAEMSETKPKKIASYNFDPFYDFAYRSHFHALNPFIPGRLSQMAETVSIGNSITDTAAYRASSFYNEFAKPQGWEAFISVNLNGPGGADVFALMRSQKTDFAQTGIEHFLTLLAPHLRRAYDLSSLLAHSRQTAEFLGRAIATAGFGTILLSEKCRIVYANEVAEELLRQQQGLAFIRGELVAEATTLTSRLAAMVRACVDPRALTDPLTTMLELPRRGSDQPIRVHVLPLQEKTAAMVAHRARPVAALFLVNPQHDLSTRMQSFADAYSLTSIEIAILGELIHSESLTLVAAKLGVSASTLRTHMGRLMAKTGTRNRLELLRSFFEMFCFASR
ncbi:helix-turn-helix transcriptional regulator [Beijerinckia indica]|uniref:Transcriptional regulator, LuxR family n=1 Tax=Beijerinckia indica subsp. indica (strain ATCC 9039 / DSM 1715 / NCIMB 8712) TaxID=395963 RepID=B2IF49_BEII9|nr:helix-turn-helix transcriptional regulator [Beijerinckia indica]ACB95614.1 transcriptional regulator, LuxR family [Beijerinckia indica subsp. indica ATCC 9039]